MKFYGIELASGTEIAGLIVERSHITPTTVINSVDVEVPLSDADKGRLYYNTTGAGHLQLWNGTQWNTIASTNAGIVTSVNGRTGDISLTSSDVDTAMQKASTSVWGKVKIGNGLVVTDGIISISVPTKAIPDGTIMLFGQASAPIGWTQIISDASNNRMLRVVNTATGGDVAGTDSPILMNVVPSHTHTMSGSTDIGGSHSHTYTYAGGMQPQSGSSTWCWWSTSTQNTSVAGAHSHTLSGSIGANSGAANWSPRYLNLIMCSKDPY